MRPEQLHSGSGERDGDLGGGGGIRTSRCRTAAAHVPLHEPLDEPLGVPEGESGVLEVQPYVHASAVQQRGGGGGLGAAAGGERDVVLPRGRLRYSEAKLQ